MPQLTLQQAFDLALQHHQAGQLPQAEQIYRQILSLHPNHSGAIHSLGVIAHQVGRYDLALDLIRQAISLNPTWPVAHYNLGLALKGNGQLPEAILAFRQAIALDPNYPDAHNDLGVALNDNGRPDHAILAYRQAIALRTNFPQAYNNLGDALSQTGDLDQAIAACRQATALDPTQPEAQNTLGNALKNSGQLDESITAYRQAIALKPDFPIAHNNLANALKEKGQLDAAIDAYRSCAALNPGNPAIHSNLIYALYFHPDCDAKTITREHQLWTHLHAQPLQKFIKPHSNDPNPDRPLRLGYLSPDFKCHVVGKSLLPLFQHHDRQQFHITCYANVLRPDALTAQFHQLAHTWRNIAPLSNEQVANQIREDQIDILIDLALHMADNRLPVFARKPAPVQVTYLGHCGTTGLGTIDYRLSDPYLDPPDSDLSGYTEKTIRLPSTFWCYTPMPFPLSEEIPSHRAGFITFGCLNNFAKVSPAALNLWTTILAQIPNSRLILHTQEGDHRQSMRDLFASRGINPHRIEFIPTLPLDQYAKTYDRIDISLDPFPYVGGITTCDSLWMGVPVITLDGAVAFRRCGVSILSNVGLPNLIANTQDEYRKIATDLAADLPTRTALRQNLRSRMQSSPLMDAPKFARDVEQTYRQMWHAWCDAPRG